MKKLSVLKLIALFGYIAPLIYGSFLIYVICLGEKENIVVALGIIFAVFFLVSGLTGMLGVLFENESALKGTLTILVMENILALVAAFILIGDISTNHPRLKFATLQQETHHKSILIYTILILGFTVILSCILYLLSTLSSLFIAELHLEIEKKEFSQLLNEESPRGSQSNDHFNSNSDIVQNQKNFLHNAGPLSAFAGISYNSFEDSLSMPYRCVVNDRRSSAPTVI